MNKQDMDDIFTQRARKTFLASLGSLEPGTLARLSAARRKAVDAVGQSRGWSWGWRMPAGAVALAFVAVVGGTLLKDGGTPTPAAAYSAANTDPLMLAGDNLDMYADLDFYQWMETQDQPVQAPDDGTVDDSDDSDDDTGVGG